MTRSTSIFIFLILLLFPAFSHAQIVHQLALREIIHKNINYSTIAPKRVEVSSKGGFVEYETLYTDKCVERFRFEFEFDQDMTTLECDREYPFSYSAKLISPQCNNNRTPYMRPLAPNGGWSSLAGLSGYDQLVNNMGVISQRLYAKNLGRPNTYQTGTLKGHYACRPGNKGQHTWLNMTFDGSSNLNGEHFYYEILFIYEFTDEKPAESFSCPPPDCSGFPGTIPVWNFQTNRGECWCPEGMVWDRMTNKCISASR